MKLLRLLDSTGDNNTTIGLVTGANKNRVKTWLDNPNAKLHPLELLALARHFQITLDQLIDPDVPLPEELFRRIPVVAKRVGRAVRSKHAARQRRQFVPRDASGGKEK